MENKPQVTIYYLDGTSETRDMTPDEITELPQATDETPSPD